MKCILVLSLCADLLAMTAGASSGELQKNLDAVGKLNGFGGGIGVQNVSPDDRRVYQEQPRRPSQGDKGNIKFDPHRNDAYGSGISK